MPKLWDPRRHCFAFGILAFVIILASSTLLHGGRYKPLGLLPSGWTSSASADADGLILDSPEVVDRVRHQCRQPDEFEQLYGRDNLRMSRAYEGSYGRMQRFLHKVMSGQPVTVGIVGGSVTRGHGIEYDTEAYWERLGRWMNDFFGRTNIKLVNGAIPASGSDYFSYCFALHVPADADLVFIELGINDEGLPEHIDNMENLIRGLSVMENQPAVVLLEVIGMGSGQMAGAGGRMHLPVAEYFDVPVISQRLPLAKHFARFPEVVPLYFVPNYWGDPDLRHINARGHKDMAALIESFIRDVSCDMVNHPHSNFDEYWEARTNAQHNVLESLPHSSYDDQMKKLFGVESTSDGLTHLGPYQSHWPSDTRAFEHTPRKKHDEDPEPVPLMYPGLWPNEGEFSTLPRLRALDGWDGNLEHRQPEFHPVCYSTRAHEPQFNLTPIANEGWEWWVHENFQDKPYLVAREPGAKATFEIETHMGIIRIYSLRSATFGFGQVFCWVDDNHDKGTTIDGHWEDENLNIGRFSLIGENLTPGKHTVTCELLEETNDPEGRHEFRLISLMSR